MADRSLLKEVAAQNGGLSPEEAAAMRDQGLDPTNEADREKFFRQSQFVNETPKTASGTTSEERGINASLNALQERSPGVSGLVIGPQVRVDEKTKWWERGKSKQLETKDQTPKKK